MKNAISVIDIFATIKKRWKLIVLTTSVALIISIIISFFVMTPVYQASTEILVNQKNSENKLDITLMQSNVDLINTYSMIIKSPVILDKVIENLNLTLSEEQLNEKIAINSSENSQVFSIVVEDTNSVRAVEIANSTSETFQKEIKGIMKVDNVSILAKAEIKDNPTPIKPNRLLNSTIAIVVGVMAGISCAIILDHLDKTIREDQDIEAYLGLPVLGYIPKITDKMVEKVEYVNFEIADDSDEVTQEITTLRKQVEQEKIKLHKNEVIDEISEIVEQLNVTLKKIVDQEIAFSKLVDFAVQGIFTAEIIAVKKQEIAEKIELLKEEQEELTAKLKNISIVSVESKLQKVLEVIEEFEDLEVAASDSHDGNERIKRFVRKVEEVNTI